MADNRFVFDGLDDLKAALRNLPDELAGEAGRIVETHANSAAVTIRAAYGAHRRTGNLQEHVSIDRVARGRYGAAARVKSTARHAHLFETGTKARHYITRRGVRHVTGAAEPQHVFVPEMIRVRRRMYEELKALLVRNGIQVSGDAE